MDADGSGFSFPTSSDYQKGQDASDVSWADIFLDGIHSDDPGSSEAAGVSTDTSTVSAGVHAGTQQLVQQPQPGVLGGQLQIHIPTHLQGSLTSNGIQQAGTNLCGAVAYLTPAVSNQQQVANAGRIQNVMAVAGQHQVAATVGQQQHQGSAKLVQIASSFPVASVQQLTNSVPIQTLLPNQTITGQTIYGSQGTGLFPTQGSVHIENPKVVNVNFGPHVIGSDGSGQQAIIQTAEGKSVLITNSQLQHLPQSISLTQPLVGAQLISSAGGNVIRTSMTQGTQQIMLPSGQTVIPRQTSTTQGGITKNVVLRPLNSNMSPVIYQSGQTGSLIHSQPALITSSGTGLQVVNTGRSQGGQVQLITQPSISQTGIGHQQLMNLLSNQGIISNTGNQIAGLMPGQNIVVNGQVLNISQLGGLTLPHLQVQHNPQGGVTLATHYQPATQQVIIQHNGQQQQQQQQQQHTLQQPKSTQSSSVLANIVQSQRLSSGLTGSKNLPTPTSNINSCSSTPTPSTPTPTRTPDIMSDSCDTGGKSSQSINILEQALALSAIDLQSLGDDINFLDNMDCFPTVTTPPASVTPLPPVSKPKLQPARTKSKNSKPKPKAIQPVVNVTVNSSGVQLQQPSTQFQNALGQKVTISPQQKIITAHGQVFVLSANGQQFILQPSPSSAAAMVSSIKSEASIASTKGIVSTAGINIHRDSQVQMKELGQQTMVQSGLGSNVDSPLKLSPCNIPVLSQQKHTPVTAIAQSDRIFIKASPGGTGHLKIETAVQSVPAAPVAFTTVTSVHNSPSLVSPFQNSAGSNEMQSLQIKNQKITTLGGTFLKQEPLEQVKEEPVTDVELCVSQAQDASSMSLPMTNLFHTSLATTTSTVITMSTPLVISSASFTAMTTTQSHQTTIMSTAQMKAQQTSVSTASSHLSCSSVLDDRSLAQSDAVCQSQVTPTFMQSVPSTAPSAVSVPTATLKPNSKEKDPANIKSMIPIKIADSTVMLSLTPGQKERLENQLSHMSKQRQEEFLIHQQNIIRRTQQVQQKQLEQQKKLIQQQQLQQKSQQQHCQQSEELQQLERAEKARQTPKLQLQHLQLQQQQSQQMQHQSPAPLQQQQQQQPQQVFLQQTHPQATSTTPHISRSEHTSSQAGHVGTGLPTTVQEVLEQSEESNSQQHCQQFSALKPPEQPFIEQTQQPVQQQPVQQQPVQQQHGHQNLQQRTLLNVNSAIPIHSFIIPQLGRCLAEQQLLRDRSLAISPDVNTSFKSLSDAMRRLVRYHTLQDHKPEEGSRTMKIWDTRYSKLCDYLVKTKRCYMRRFSKVQLYHDMCPYKQPEHIQNLMCFNEQLRELIDSEKDRAKNQPDLFEPINPAQSFHQSSSTATPRTSVEDPEHEHDEIIDSSEDCQPDAIQLAFFGHKEPYTDDNCGSARADLPHASLVTSPPRQKRKLPETGSSGTLKLVLKRRTTDNFIVKTSSANVYELSEDLKPTINVEKSDSEYEYDSHTAVVACSQPVVIRQRTLSMSSRLTSSEAASDNSSLSSQADKIQDHSSVEDNSDEERDENNDEDDEVSDEGEEIEKSSIDDNEIEQQFIGNKECSSEKYCVSGSDELQNNDVDNDVSCNVSSDAFMENDEIMESVEALNRYSINTVEFSGRSVVRPGDENGANLDSPHSGKNSSASTTSEDVFHSNLSYPHADSPHAKDKLKYCGFSDEKRADHSTVTLQAPAIGVSTLFGQSCRTSPCSRDEEYMSESSLSSIKKETSTKGPLSSSIFITPNNNLLETDAMFNSDDDDDDELSGNRRLVSTFKIDNKDPQSSMINDSVRSAINSVLDGDEDDDDDDDDSQNNWASTANRLPLSSSSSSIHNLFHSSLSSSHTHSHDADLDAAVQSILNS